MLLEQVLKRTQMYAKQSVEEETTGSREEIPAAAAQFLATSFYSSFCRW